MDNSQLWQLDKKLACRTVDDETIVIGIDRGEVHMLNDTASYLWNALLDKAQSIDTLTALLVSQYAVDQTTASQDVLDFIQQLITKGLLTAATDTRKATL